MYQQNPKDRRRRRLPSPPRDTSNTRSCASLSCDVDARISCGGKTFETKSLGTKKTEQSCKPNNFCRVCNGIVLIRNNRIIHLIYLHS